MVMGSMEVMREIERQIGQEADRRSRDMEREWYRTVDEFCDRYASVISSNARYELQSIWKTVKEEARRQMITEVIGETWAGTKKGGQ